LARVFAINARGEQIEKALKDRDDGKVLANDGSSATTLEILLLQTEFEMENNSPSSEGLEAFIELMVVSNLEDRIYSYPHPPPQTPSPESSARERNIESSPPRKR
jgi:hypothetical protein